MITRKAMLRVAIAIFTASLATLAAILAVQVIPRGIVLSDAEREWLRSRDGTINFWGDIAYPPIDFFDDNGRHDGISEDILAAVEKKLGVTFLRVAPPDWPAVLEGARTGKLDAIAAVSYAPDRESYLALTSSYLDMPTVFVTLDSNDEINTARDLAGKRVCITAGYSSYDFFRDSNPGFEIVPVANDCEGLMTVASGGADAALSEIPVISWYVSKKNVANLRIVGESGYLHKISFGVRKDLPLLRSALDKALASITPGDKRKIIEKWISVEYRNAFYSANTWIVIASVFAGAAAVVLFIGLWDRSLRSLVRARTRELNGYKKHLEELVESRTRELAEANLALARANAALEVLARTDTLTGCSNRRAFLELAEREHERARRHGTTYGMIEFDLDHFKIVNDRHGHAAGDSILTETAGIIAGMLRSNDIFGRVGGEEFFILLPDASLEESLATAERLREALARTACVRAGGEILRFTASFGVTAYRGEARLEEVMARADAALYRAKGTGRNRVESG